MAIEINVPDIGADEVEVTEIMVKVGDTVEAEQSLITVEGDKASMEVPSPQAGVVKEIKIAVGDTVATGKLMIILKQQAPLRHLRKRKRKRQPLLKQRLLWPALRKTLRCRISVLTKLKSPKLWSKWATLLRLNNH